LDQGEKVEDAALREAREEAGVEVETERLLNVYSYRGEPVIVIVYAGTVVGGVPEARDETLEAKLFERQEIPWDELAFASTRDALRDYFRQR